MTLAQIRRLSRELPVLLAGPTASGKSALAMEIASRDGRVIVNADALQVYGCWRILTARPSLSDEAALPHALYGHVGREEAYSVGHWLRQVAPLLDRPVVIVGGTGLYFSALTEGLAPVPDVPASVRAEADSLRLAGQIAQMVREIDPETAGRTDLANPARVQRAWEVLRATGLGLAHWQQTAPLPLLPLKRCEALVLQPDVNWLNARIGARFSAMLEAGALAEVAAELPGWDTARPSARAIGAAELVTYLQSSCDLSNAEQAATQATRQYAKRQRTWFRSRMKSWLGITLG
jgi:tRNA dimethylallyltransferase